MPEANPMTGAWHPYPQPWDPTQEQNKQNNGDCIRRQKGRLSPANACGASRTPPNGASTPIQSPDSGWAKASATTLFRPGTNCGIREMFCCSAQRRILCATALRAGAKVPPCLLRYTPSQSCCCKTPRPHDPADKNKEP